MHVNQVIGDALFFCGKTPLDTCSQEEHWHNPETRDDTDAGKRSQSKFHFVSSCQSPKQFRLAEAFTANQHIPAAIPNLTAVPQCDTNAQERTRLFSLY